MIKKQSGFTLIELLVVIAIIGILAATIMASLNDARISAVDAKVMTEMDGIAKRAEIEKSNTLAYDAVCNSNGSPQSAVITELIASIDSMASSTVVCNSETTEYAVSVGLETEHWCVDNTGSRTARGTALGGGEFSCQ